jgi:SAM-dependent methyltransferase
MDQSLEQRPLLQRVGGARALRRTPGQLREHYEIERELAERLRSVPETVRRALYPLVYDELYRRVPHHPMVRARLDPETLAASERNLRRQFRFLEPFLTPRTVFMEIGAGDCALSMQVAGYVERVYAIGASEAIVRGMRPPSNLRFVLSDGISLPVPEASVHFAFSDQQMEHLHPDDARQQLRNIYRRLAPGARYLCTTPNRHYGPCDISGYFDEVATGLHLREYSADELRGLLHDCGFSAVHFYAGARGIHTRVPYAMVRALEGALAALPHPARRRLARAAPMRAALGLRVMAIK